MVTPDLDPRHQSLAAAVHGPGPAPKVSVIVPHYNDLDRLDKCLNALTCQTYPSPLVEIIVADNASPQGADVVAERIAGRAKLVVVHERGAGPARNGGVSAATADVLAFTDSDCLPDARWLEAGVEALRTAPIVGGRVFVLVEDEQRMTGPEAFERVFAFDNRRYVEQLGFSVTANLFCGPGVFKTVGGFRVGVSEDLEWCRRAADKGFRLAYSGGAAVSHPARRTWPELKGKWRRLNRETYALGNGTTPARLRWLARCLLLPLSAVAHTPRVLTAPGLTRTSQRMSAIVVLFRLRLWRMIDSVGLALQREAGH